MNRILVLFVLAALLMLPVSAWAQEDSCVMKKGTVYAADEQALNSALQAVESGDKTGLRALVQAGKAGLAPRDTNVYKVQAGYSGKVVVRPEGSSETVWTLGRFLDCLKPGPVPSVGSMD